MSVQAFSEVGPLGNNVYVVYDDAAKKALLVDPAMQSQPVWDFLQERGLELLYIVNTHGHSDHIWNNAYFKQQAPQAKLLIHRGDEQMLSQLVTSTRQWGATAEPSPAPDGYLEDGAMLEVGSVRVQVLHTPGHTPGSSCLYVPAHSVGGDHLVMTGDTLFMNSIGRYDFPGGSLPQLLTSIRTKLLALPDATTVCPGHGPMSDIGSERESNPFLDEEQVRRMGLL